MKRILVVRTLTILPLIALIGCGEDSDQTYERGYEAGYDVGYDDGQWDVCSELGSVAPGLKDSLPDCRGF